MKQVDVDLCGLPEVDEYRYRIFCIDFFRKWSESKPITDKTAPTVASFVQNDVQTWLPYNPDQEPGQKIR